MNLNAIHFERHSQLNQFFQHPIVKSATDLFSRIKKAVSDFFSLPKDFFVKQKTIKESSIKSIAIIGCLSLVTLLVITILLRRDRDQRRKWS